MPPVPTRRLPGFPSSTLFGLAVPTVCSRPSRRLPWLDFVATTGRGRAPNKGTWLPAASPRKVLFGWWRDGDRLLWSGQEGAGGPVSLIWQLQRSATSHPTYVSPTAPLSWPTGFREEVPLGLPAHWARASRRSLLSGSQCWAPLDASFVCPAPGRAFPLCSGQALGSVGRAAVWRLGAPTWSPGGWGQAEEPAWECWGLVLA